MLDAPHRLDEERRQVQLPMAEGRHQQPPVLVEVRPLGRVLHTTQRTRALVDGVSVGECEQVTLRVVSDAISIVY